MAIALDHEPQHGTLLIKIGDRASIKVNDDDAPPRLRSEINFSARLISIDGKAVKGFSIEQVRKFADGPVGSFVTLEILTYDGMKTLVLKRHPISTSVSESPPADTPRRAALVKVSELLDGFDDTDIPSSFYDAISRSKASPIESMNSALMFVTLQLCD